MKRVGSQTRPYHLSAAVCKLRFVTTDIIVVGAGSAGCAVAARLAERGHTVLLVEAGGEDRRLFLQIPAAFSKLFRTPVDWAWETVPQQALDHRALFWPRGKVLGGTSSINAMLYTEGHPADYDGWAARGCSGWSWEEVAPVFARLPLRIEPQIAPNPISLAFLDAMQAAGVPLQPRLTGPRGRECGLFRTTMHQGRRWSASRAYLQGAMPPGLSLRLDTRVRRVLFEKGRATGVEVLTDGEVTTLHANRAVVLAGGVINSPQLLLLSGIGPGADLRALGIPVVSDVPGVGQNLQDHLSVGMSWRATRPVTLDGANTVWNLLRWLLFRRGPLTSPIAEAAAFLPDKGTIDPRPMLELVLGPVWFANHGFDRRPGHHYTMGAVLLHPESRGEITLATPDPMAAPRVDPQCLARDEDARRLLAGLRLIRRIGGHEAFAPWRGEEVFPGPGAETDDELVAHIRAHSQSLYHPVGTCRMGPASDPRAVVDPSLRVRGVERLYVADASIMPEIPSAHTNAPAMMIGERAAELVDSDHCSLLMDRRRARAR